MSDTLQDRNEDEEFDAERRDFALSIFKSSDEPAAG